MPHKLVKELKSLIIETLLDVYHAHRDPESCDFNDCEKDPCAWCEDADEIIKALEGKVVVDRVDLKKMFENLESGYKFISDQLGKEPTVEDWIFNMNERYLPKEPPK